MEIAVRSIPALLAMKGLRPKRAIQAEDAYDISYCIRATLTASTLWH
ncbi:hypothetical protein ACPOL_0300 [Acidisarcina polymorpha]|uniref:Uncharacterized protein n=1 Tax=Acidisarcina polymorpha TaxID=2211140 RepID=A0A2Z5FSC2_9BACT|nr:hypothetical protein ACPOL_0300 [Acidisarcina polymorpha]